jgi:hypothetical protein
MVGEAQGDVSIAKHIEDVVLIPTRMPEFERVAPPPVEELDKGGETVAIFRELGRELEQHWPSLRP